VGTNSGVYDNPNDLTENSWTVMRFTETEQNGKFEWLIRKDGCMHCSEPGCLKACPAPGAIIQYANGIVDFHQENCIGCGYCVTGCPFNVPRISKKDNKAYKCSLCSDRIAVNQAPACAKVCPTGAIKFGSKEDMKDYAEKRITDLKERGYDKAGLYDPAGVGGTHVMYVLHHADQPTLYAGLPENPSISPLVALWKGATKPLATMALGLVALGSLFHYVVKGPNEVSKEIEDEVEKEDA
jgi:formate dehydrogenase iron-sulfur subunit